MTGCRFMARVALVACVTLSGASSGFAADVPERSADGQTLRVPAEQAALGEVYYVLPGAGTQFTWETDAPLFRVVATCNRVVGYTVAPFEFEDGTPPLLAGALRVPVASLTTGYEQLDAALHGSDGFDQEKHMEVLISFVSAGPAKNVVKEDNREHCEFALTSELTINGKATRVESPAHVALLPFTRSTEPFSPSDLLILRTKFKIALADVGMTAVSPFGPGFAGESADVELYMMCTTIHPKKNFDPRVDDAAYVKQLQFMTRLRDLGDPVDAYAYGRAFMKEIWDDGRLLNDLAWAVLTDEHVERRDLAFAEEAVKRANELTKHKDPQYLHTLARWYYERGDLDGAVKWSRKAVENLIGQPFFVGPPIRAALEDYEAQARVNKKATTPSTNE